MVLAKNLSSVTACYHDACCGGHCYQCSRRRVNRKVEADETVFQALQRELREEVGIQVITAQSWLQLSHDYGDRKVLLDIWKVTQFSGEPEGREGQDVRWVATHMLDQFKFPDGNRGILEKLV